MNILITGGTGFIGSRLVEKLVQKRHHIYILSRNPKNFPDTEYISYIGYNYPVKRLPVIHAVFNLAGETLYGYWSHKKKQAILTSRLETTEKLIEMMVQMKTKPQVFITGSAVGFYGMSNEVMFTEKTKLAGTDFLATVTAKWEKSANVAEDFGIRTIYTRFGVVLDRHEGALPLMALPFKWYVGGKIGTGNQWISWVHIDDCVNMLLFTLQDKTLEGPVNITSPYPKQNADFTKILAKTLRRPAMMRTPTSMLKVVLGGMHQLITEGQFVFPQKAQDHNFEFTYPHLEDALKEIYHIQ